MSNADGDFDIYVMEPDSGTIVNLTDAPGQDGTPVWSPDGKRLVFASERSGSSDLWLVIERFIVVLLLRGGGPGEKGTPGRGGWWAGPTELEPWPDFL